MSGRSYVKHRNDRPSPRPVSITRRLGKAASASPAVTIIIPTADGTREGYLPALLQQLESQTWQDFEVIMVEGDNRQGRAINTAADEAIGQFLVTFDDDSRLGSNEVLQRLVETMQTHPDVGMAGGENRVPEDAPWLVRRLMTEVPRRSTPPVVQVTDSDLAEHPCLIMRREVFLAVGGENELIPRGLDPYLRHAFRQAGYRVVVAPGIVYHHLPPRGLLTIVRQFFRNGSQSRFCSRNFPEWVYETPDTHGSFHARRPLWYRVARGLAGMVWSVLTLRWVNLLCSLSYACGWAWEELSSRKR
ncbi:MAG: glycosyltransferase family 2 protein [Candidatus Xenobia bacterium]